MTQTTATAQTVENLKAHGQYAQAGRLARDLGLARSYGCHFGMRSEKGRAEAHFLAAYDDQSRKVRGEELQAQADGIEFGYTGADWEPKADTRFFAQKDELFAFAATIPLAIRALKDLLVKKAAKDARDEEVLTTHRLGDKFHRELGRVIGTEHCPTVWARHFGCEPAEASRAIDYLLGSGRARLVGGRLYAL